MENSTYFNNASSFTFRQGFWISDLVFSYVFLIVSLYLFVALLYHHIKVEKPMKAKFLQLKLGKKYRVLSKYTCILIGIFPTIRCLCDIGMRSVEWNVAFSNKPVQPTNSAEIACNVLPQVSAAAVSFGYFFVYVVLWLRQNMFYIHPTLKVLYNNKLKVFSFSILLCYLLLAISFFTTHLAIARYAINKAGFCLLQAEKKSVMWYFRLLIAWNILSILMQILQLGLFIYPLLNQSSWRKNQQDMQNCFMLQVVKKAVILASISLVTDTVVMIFFILLFDEDKINPSFMYQFNVNLIINHLVTIGCFNFWRKLLWPWSIKCHLLSSFRTADETSTSSPRST